CVDVDVLKPTEVGVTVTVEIKPKDGYDFASVKSQVEAAVKAMFDGKLLGGSVLLAHIANVIYSVEGVYNYKLSSPTGDTEAGSTSLPVLSSVTVTEMVD